MSTETSTIAPCAPPTPPSSERADVTQRLLTEAAGSKPRDAARIRQQVVVLNTPVADSIAGRYRHRGVADDDLRQIAYVALVKAVQRFELARDHDLLSYAVPTIRGEIRRHFRDQGWTVRPPRRIQELQTAVHAATEDLSHRLGREPSRGDIATELHVSPRELDGAYAAYGAFTPTSLDAPATEGASATLGDVTPDDGHDQSASEARLMLAPVVRRLPRRDRRILYLRFYADQTQAEIGRDLGVTQMQVSRLLGRILAELHDQLTEPEASP